MKRKLETRYIYDPKTLDYKEIRHSLGKKIGSVLIFCTSSLCLAFAIYFLTFDYFESPKEKVLHRELDNMKYRYEEISYRIDQSIKDLESIKDKDNNIYRVYFEADSIPNDVRKAGFGGVDLYASLQGFDNSKLISTVSQKLDILDKQLAIQTESLDEVADLAVVKKKKWSSLPAIQPLENKDLRRVASGFGIRWHPIIKTRKMHFGMDFSAKTGTPIYATANGVIKRISSKGSFGKHIIINHGFGYETLYAHMNRFATRKGQKVKRGEIIGYVGNTGMSAGPHLHYEIRKDGKRLDPINFYSADLSPDEYQRIKRLASRDTKSYD